MGTLMTPAEANAELARRGLLPISGGDGTGESDVTFSPEQQDKLNAILAEDRRKAEKERDDAIKAALADAEQRWTAAQEKKLEREERNRLKEEGDLRKLVNDLEPENERLKNRVTELEAELRLFHESVETDYADIVAAAPEDLLLFDPGAEASPAQKRTFVQRVAAALAKRAEDEETARAAAERTAPVLVAPGAGPSPKPMGRGNAESSVNKQVALEAARRRVRKKF